MSKRKNLNNMLGIAVLATMLGTGAAYAQSALDGSVKDNAASSQNSPSGQGSPSGTNPMTGDTSSGASGTGSSSASGTSSSPSQNATASGGAISKSDQKLMKDLAYANMAEIQAGKIAQEKGNSEEVKNFAQKMVDDHTKAQDQLQQLAQANGVTLPDTLDKKHQSEIDKLSSLSGDKFDKTYLSRGGVSDHQKAHALLSRIEKQAKSPELKTLASNMKPTIDEHLQLAKQVQSGKASTATGSSGTAGTSSSSAPAGSNGSSMSPPSTPSSPSGATDSTAK